MRNFGYDQPIPASERWERADEFVGVIRALWDSVEDDALLRDRSSGRFFDWNKFHPLRHKGKYFQVEGPLNCLRPPQGYPVQVQAGTSEFAHDFTGKYTDVFFAGVSDLVEAKAYYNQLKSRLAMYGRAADDLKVLPAIAPYVAESAKEARAVYDHLNELLDGEINVAGLSQLFEMDLSDYNIDGPPPLHLLKPDVEEKRMAGPLIRRARSEGLSIRHLAYAHQASVFGHYLLFGSAKEIADTLQTWLENDACDGFNICPPYLPDSLDNFLEGVVPELQRRGIFRTEYRGSTFRDHLGLARPENQFAGKAHSDERHRQDAALPHAAAG